LEMMIRVWSISFANRQRVTQRAVRRVSYHPDECVSRLLNAWGQVPEDRPKSTVSRYCRNS